MTEVNSSVKLIWFPKVFSARNLLLAPNALEIIEEPPMPIAIPKAAIKNETGKTTLIAAIAIEPIQLPTKMVSTKTFKDITRIPMDAGTACFINKLPMDSVPRDADLLFIFYFYYLFPEIDFVSDNLLFSFSRN